MYDFCKCGVNETKTAELSHPMSSGWPCDQGFYKHGSKVLLQLISEVTHSYGVNLHKENETNSKIK